MTTMWLTLAVLTLRWTAWRSLTTWFCLLLFASATPGAQGTLPRPCSALPPIDLLELAVPSLTQLPAGVSLLYDTASHVHAFSFSRDASDIYLRADRLMATCQFFPYEFSIFLSMKMARSPRREECLLSLYDQGSHQRVVSLALSHDRLVFQFKDKRYKFKNNAYRDKRWHTYGFSMAADSLAMTTDCRDKRVRAVRAPFPNFLPLANTSFSLGRCKHRRTIFQGMLKDVVLVAGADAVVRACPPRQTIRQGLNNVIRTFPGYNPLPSFSTGRSQCEWTDVGNIAYDIYASKLRVCVNGVWREVALAPEKRKLDYFVQHQYIDTGAESLDVEVFSIPGEGKFAAFANAAFRSGRPGVSSIFKWVNNRFEIYQKLETNSAQAWEFFEIKDQFFLAVANYGSSTSEQANSTIFKWRKKHRKFRVFQQIPTWTARDLEHFVIGEQHYLAVANHAQGDKNLVDSVIYLWDEQGQVGLFREQQRIPTLGAYDWTHFTVNGFHFLALANAFTGLTTLTHSALYLFRDGAFVQFQTMETNGATDWEFFTIADEAYLAVANAYNYGSQNYLDIDNYVTNSTIYRLNQAKRVFEKYQSIPTYSAIDWEYMRLGEDHYLLVSNAQNGGEGVRLLSVVYRWQGVERFVPVHAMATLPNADLDVFSDGEDVYLLSASAKSATSQLLKVKFV